MLFDVCDQTVSGKVRCVIDRRYVVSGRRRYDRRAMRDYESIRYDDKAASRLVPKGDDDHFDFYDAMNVRNDRHDLTAAALPRPAMNSRRLIRSPRRRVAELIEALQGQAPWRS